ncbi:multiple inositol polyphosphate phosphatase [Pseudovirgaria hyperparasitica]|uniref:Multiple inositol polyphosphate phosphatase n=1 Tax=Pseudovirgaria hyperparasitica TaxID=470096 RepID=A0A6A6WJR4_9PEZI|nr:multiple inositol polyphosphate phosphatase [Pseudovirgaria hyperparasitica]KAF2762490.1 multiple inositol polyphosphate phosphatase [Pseudovirgaria hyperparasitica]
MSSHFLLAIVAGFSALCFYQISHYLSTSVDIIHLSSLRNPHAASWTSWFHPQRQWGYGDEPTAGTLPQQDGGRYAKDWNILYHLGGNGPWVEKIDGVVEGGIMVPKGCVVDQVHMMSRHAERYPTTKAGVRIMKPLKRIQQQADVKPAGDLAFVSDWDFISSDPQTHFEQLTSTGPFAGKLGAFTTGIKLRTRYAHLLPKRLAPNGKTNFWASDSARVIETARHFGAGFFGLNWEDTSTLHVIPETAERGGDTLTPGDTCKRYLHDMQKGHDQGYSKIVEFRDTYIGAAKERLLKDNPEFKFTNEEVFAMQELCAFEITTRGSSLWCDVFSREDWLNFEYARDVIHYYRAGPGTPYAATMGGLYLNATAKLLEQGPEAGPFFFSFVHDGDMTPLLSALDIFHDDEDLPTTHRVDSRAWRTSQITPMGGRIIFERMTCDVGLKEKVPHVRINMNDGIVALPGCQNGPGHSCPLDDFLSWTRKRMVEIGDFNEVCGLRAYEPDAPDMITFLHQHA